MISRTAFFDELVKIGEERATDQESSSKKKRVDHALKTMGVGAVGLALGYGVSDLIAHKTGLFKNPTSEKAMAAKVILPILAGTTAMLAERYRSKMTDQYSNVRGFRDPRKKSF